MQSIFHFNPELDIPIYQQLVDHIRAAVKSGVLKPGQQLPTVQDISADLSIAKGTIKRAYDELEREGLVEKIQGRGTFVCGQPQQPANRKEYAMAAIDEMLHKLESVGFTTAEIGIYVDLKLRQRAESEYRVKIAVLECNPENLRQMSDQLRAIPHVELFSYLTDSIEEYPYKLEEDLDLIITTAAHADHMEHLLSGNRRVIRVALRLSRRCLQEIIRLRKGQKVGILCYSPRFGNLLETTCQTYAEEVLIDHPLCISEEEDLGTYLKDKDAILVPPHYTKYCTRPMAEALRRYSGSIIQCSYELDEGSFLYLQEKTKRLLASKMS